MNVLMANGNYFESEYNHVVLFNSKLNRYETETMEQVVRERDEGKQDRDWVVVDMFYSRAQAVEYIEKNR